MTQVVYEVNGRIVNSWKEAQKLAKDLDATYKIKYIEDRFCDDLDVIRARMAMNR